MMGGYIFKLRKPLFHGFYISEDGDKIITLDGKQIKGAWVEGNYYKIPAPPVCFKEDLKAVKDKHYIIFENPNSCPDWGMPRQMVRAEVIPETVSEYLCLTDKNDVKIFDDSILYNTDQSLCEERYRIYKPIGYGQWKSGNDIYNIFEIKDHIKDFEVIGNIFETPELLEEKQ